MRRTAIVVSGLALAIALAWWLLASGPAAEPQAGERAADTAAAGPGAKTAAGASARRQEQAGPGAKPAIGAVPAGAAADADAAPDQKTPPLGKPATEADGFFEIAVFSNEKPLSGAAVALYWRGGSGGRGRGGIGAPVWRTAGAGNTGRDGVLRLPARPGAYLVSAHAQPLAPVSKEVLRPTGAPVTRVELKLVAGHVLEGRTVARVGLEPVALASVTAAPALRPVFPGGPQAGTLPPEERQAAQSDTNGRFKITVGEGTFRVEASAPGHSRAVAASVVVPHPGELVLELPPAAVIEGTVKAADGSPADGAEVFSIGTAGLLGANSFASTVAAKGGGFSLEVEPGTHQLSAQRNGEAGAERKPIQLAAGATVRGVVLQLGKPAAIAGQVTAHATGAPIPGALASLRAFQSASELWSTVSDATGTFSFEGLSPGVYDVAVHADGFTDQLRRGITIATAQRFPLQVTLTGTGALAGVVRDGGGRTVANALVRISAGGGGGFGGGGGPFGGGPGGLLGAAPQQALTDASGRYRLDGLTPGTARASASRDETSFGPTRAADVQEGQDTPLDLTLTDNGILRGRVTRKSGQPVDPGTSVRAVQSGAMGGFQDGAVLANADADPSGAFSLSVPPGNYRVFATAPGVATQRRQQPTLAAVSASQPAQVDLVLDDTIPGTTGSVLEPAGTPAGGAAVALVSAEGQIVGLAAADGEGRFNASQFRGAAPASVRARNGGRIGEALVPQGGGDVTVTLRPAATLHGKVGGGDPPASFTVALAPTDPQRALWGQQGQGAAAQEFTGDSFDLFDAPGVDVTVTVKAVDGRTGSQAASLQPGQDASVTVTLQDSATVNGRVLAPDGTAVVGAAVLVDGAPRRGGGGSSGADGRFKLTGLAPGDHTLTIRSGRMSAPARAVTLAAAQVLDLGDVTLQAPKAPPGSIGANFFASTAGVALGGLLPFGPADQAGLREGDLVTSIDGAAVASAADATARSQGAPGTPVSIAVNRGGAAVTAQVTRATQ